MIVQPVVYNYNSKQWIRSICKGRFATCMFQTSPYITCSKLFTNCADNEHVYIIPSFHTVSGPLLVTDLLYRSVEFPPKLTTTTMSQKTCCLDRC